MRAILITSDGEVVAIMKTLSIRPQMGDVFRIEGVFYALEKSSFEFIYEDWGFNSPYIARNETVYITVKKALEVPKLHANPLE